MSTPRLLFLAPRLPWPLDTGGKIRTYYLLRALCRATEVQLLTFGDPRQDDEPLEAMAQLGARCELVPLPGKLAQALQLGSGLLGPVPYNVRKYWTVSLQQRLQRLAAQRGIQAIHCDHLHMAPAAALSGLPFVVDEHNVETVIWDRFARDDEVPRVKRLLFAQQAFWLRRLERALCSRAALVTLCSQADQQALHQLLGLRRRPPTCVIPNGVDVERFAKPGPAHGPGGHVFFTGSMDWAPNDNAVLAFLDEIWPVMRKRTPELRFVVVGRNPSARLRQRDGANGVEVTGTVDDVRPHMRGALALLVPMRVGGGTRLKILEAFAAGIPVISTAIGIEGIDATDGEHFLRAETAGEFAEAVTRLRAEPELARSLTRAAAQRARERYSWDAVGQRLAREHLDRFGGQGD